MALGTAAWRMAGQPDHQEAATVAADHLNVAVGRSEEPRSHPGRKARPTVREMPLAADPDTHTTPSGRSPAMATATTGVQPPHLPEPAPPPPKFREVSAHPLTEFHGSSTSLTRAPVALEFSAQAPLPAILAARAPGAPLPGPAQSKAETRILENFIAAAQLPEPLQSGENAEADPAGQQDQDDRWEAAARIADEEVRLFLGHDTFMQQSLESAVLRLEANRIPQ